MTPTTMTKTNEPVPAAEPERMVLVKWDTCENAQGRAEDILERLMDHEDLWTDFDEAAAFRAQLPTMTTVQANEKLHELFADRLDEKAFHMACEDGDASQWEWSDLLDNLGEALERMSADGHWYCEASNLGWRHRSGYLFFTLKEAGSAKEFLRKVLPDCECTFTVYTCGDHLEMSNAHHDAPTGESYTMWPCTKKDVVLRARGWDQAKSVRPSRMGNLVGIEQMTIITATGKLPCGAGGDAEKELEPAAVVVHELKAQIGLTMKAYSVARKYEWDEVYWL